MNSTSRFKYLFIISGAISLLLIYLVLENTQKGFIFPSLTSIFKTMFDLIIKENIINLFFKSILNVLICIIISLFICLIISYFRMFNKDIHEIISPFVAFLKCAPLSILIVYFLFLFGKKNGPFIICFVVIFPLIFEGLISAFNELRTEIIWELRITDVSKIKKYLFIVIPLMLPNIVMTFLMSFGLGLKVIVMGEYLMLSPNTLGLYIYNAKTIIDIESLLAILLLCLIFTLLIEISAKFLFNKLKKKLY